LSPEPAPVRVVDGAGGLAAFGATGAAKLEVDVAGYAPEIRQQYCLNSLPFLLLAARINGE